MTAAIQLGQMVYLKSILTNVHLYGVMTDGETPDQVTATLEVQGENATLSLGVLQGPPGRPGQNAFALRLQNSMIDDPEDLPQNLTEDSEDVGKYWIMNHYGDPVNEIQQITISGGPTAGTWFLIFDGQPTAAIPYNATAAQVQAALESLTNIGVGDVSVNAGGPGVYSVTFQNTLGNINVPLMVANGALLEGGSGPAVVVQTRQEGGPKLIGSRAYIWFGDHYKVLMMGSEGPPGPVPIITPSVVLIDPDSDEESWVDVTGDAYMPSWQMHLKAPRGPRGYNTRLDLLEDVDMTDAPINGQVLAFNGTKWKPQFVGAIIPRPYIVPEASFNNYEGISTRAPIGSFAIPAQLFPWKPIVWGKIRAVGLELDSDPLIIGCEVRLGHPTTGQLVARGFGNVSGWTVLTPHTSTPSTPSVAMTPDNETALVPANHTGNNGTLYINLYNDGLAGIYLFNKANAQLFVQVNPV